LGSILISCCKFGATAYISLNKIILAAFDEILLIFESKASSFSSTFLATFKNSTISLKYFSGFKLKSIFSKGEI
jgi:hypothetical protein